LNLSNILLPSLGAINVSASWTNNQDAFISLGLHRSFFILGFRVPLQLSGSFLRDCALKPIFHQHVGMLQI
jgi:hypothetical protein